MSQTKITVVDQNDKVIGSADKKEALEKGYIRRIARVFLIDDGKIFLQKRGPNMELFPNCWDQSAGGHVDEGEDYLEAATRELLEELGIKDIELKELGKFYLEGETYKGIDSPHFSTVFTAEYSGQEIKYQESEVKSGKWISLPNVDELIKSKPESCALGFKVAWEKFGHHLAK